jgi:hypothetical protein
MVGRDLKTEILGAPESLLLAKADDQRFFVLIINADVGGRCGVEVTHVKQPKYCSGQRQALCAYWVSPQHALFFRTDSPDADPDGRAASLDVVKLRRLPFDS